MSGRQLTLLQEGSEPFDFKPMKAIGDGVRELRIRDETGAYRIIYVAKFAEAVYVLHCFQKKSQATGRMNIETAILRYRTMIRDRSK